jgi:hypothetical protein
MWGRICENGAWGATLSLHLPTIKLDSSMNRHSSASFPLQDPAHWRPLGSGSGWRRSCSELYSSTNNPLGSPNLESTGVPPRLHMWRAEISLSLLPFIPRSLPCYGGLGKPDDPVFSRSLVKKFFYIIFKTRIILSIMCNKTLHAQQTCGLIHSRSRPRFSGGDCPVHRSTTLIQYYGSVSS